MIKQIKWPFALLSLFILGACEQEVDPPPSNTQLLTQSSWKFQSATAAGTDVSNNAAIVCIKDDVITFSSSGTGTVSEGTVVCNPTTASNFTWAFLNNETTLSMSSGLFPAGSGTFTIVGLTETTLTISQNVIIPPSATAIPVTAVYIH
jgi:Lipocalin-like domain